MLPVKDPYCQNLLNINGYFLSPMLNETESEAVRSIYNRYFPGEPGSFYSTSFHPDTGLKKQVSEEILELIRPRLDGMFSDFKVLGCSFLLKRANENNPLPLHQDWTVTDEEQFGSFTIWIPLQDTVKENGALRVIDGSHRVDDQLRAPSLPVSFEKERPGFEKYLKTLEMKKGTAFVFNQKLMHASWPNRSGETRLALTIGLAPKDAPMFMLYYDPRKKEISRYSMPDDMFLHYPEIIDGPGIGTPDKTFTYLPKSLTEKEFKKRLYDNKQKSAAMQPLFQEDAHQDYFEKNGFLKVPALDDKDIAELKSFLFESGIKKETDYGFYVGMDHEDKSLVTRMMSKISEVALPKVAPYLRDFQLITASYVIKDPNPQGIVPPHQDWTFVEDESKHFSVTCWIPLQDVDMQNGCLGVIRGSNRFFDNIRPSPSPQVPSPLAKHLFHIFPYLQLIEMKAGEAIFFDNRTFHASPPNVTAESRLAVGLSFTQKEAELRHYYLKPGTKDTLMKYCITPDFYFKYDNGTLSKMYAAGQLIEGYELMGELPYEWEDLNKEEMKDRIVKAGNTYNAELTRQMMSLFGEQMRSGLMENIKNAFHRLNVFRRVRELIA